MRKIFELTLEVDTEGGADFGETRWDERVAITGALEQAKEKLQRLDYSLFGTIEVKDRAVGVYRYAPIASDED
jgi:hypothetical protein